MGGGRAPDLGSRAVRETAGMIDIANPRRISNSATDIAEQILRGGDVTAVAPIRAAIANAAAQQFRSMNTTPTGFTATLERGISPEVIAARKNQRELQAGRIGSQTAAQIASDLYPWFLNFGLGAQQNLNNTIGQRGQLELGAGQLQTAEFDRRRRSLLQNIAGALAPAALGLFTGGIGGRGGGGGNSSASQAGSVFGNIFGSGAR